jgi:hypothetical protein
LKVFSISDRNVENSQLAVIGNFTTIMMVRAAGRGVFSTLLGNKYPKEC